MTRRRSCGASTVGLCLGLLACTKAPPARPEAAGEANASVAAGTTPETLKEVTLSVFGMS